MRQKTVPQTREVGPHSGKKKPRPKKPRVKVFSKGDRVRITELSELTEELKQTPPTWVDDMDRHAGKVATVTDIVTAKTAPGGQFYILDIDAYGWSPLWLTKIK